MRALALLLILVVGCEVAPPLSASRVELESYPEETLLWFVDGDAWASLDPALELVRLEAFLGPGRDGATFEMTFVELSAGWAIWYVGDVFSDCGRIRAETEAGTIVCCEVCL